MECSAFRFAQDKDPEFLEQWQAEVPEQTELQQYHQRWAIQTTNVSQHQDSLEIHPDLKGYGLDWQSALYQVKDLRNEATHRSLSADPKLSTVSILQQRVAWAKKFAIMVGDEKQADKIQGIADEWFAEYRPDSGFEKSTDDPIKTPETVEPDFICTDYDADARAETEALWDAAFAGVDPA